MRTCQPTGELDQNRGLDFDQNCLKVTASLYEASCFLGTSTTKNGIEIKTAGTPLAVVTTGMTNVLEQSKASFVVGISEE
jgi:hypothetical protein